MDIIELAKVLGLSRRSTDIRLKKLSKEDLESIRTIERNGKSVKYVYNDLAIKTLQALNDTSKSSPEPSSPDTISKTEHLKILLAKSEEEIERLKAEIKEAKAEIKAVRIDGKEQFERFQYAIEHYQNEMSKAMNLVSNEQKLHLETLDKKSIETKLKPKFWFQFWK